MNSVTSLLGMHGMLLDTVLNQVFVRRASFCPPHSKGQEEAPLAGWYIVRFIIDESQACYIRNRGGSRNFYWGWGGGADFGSERTVVSRSLLAREIPLCEQRRTDHRRVPKNNYIFEYPWN